MDSSNISAKPLPPDRGFHRSQEFEPPATPRKPLPGWLALVVSLVVALHLFAIVIHALAANSGPWPTQFEIASPAEPPKFAEIIDNNLTLPWYLSPLRMTHNYHFNSNQTEAYAVYFEVRLKDANGKVIATLKYPEEGENAWVRHRQQLLAQSLFGDSPAQPPMVERLNPPKVPIWMPVEAESNQQKATYVLERIQEHKIPRDRPMFRPTEWSLAVAKSYVRYLCRHHGAVSGELIRHSREPVPAVPNPQVIAALPPDTFVEMVANFGEYRP